MTDSYDRPAPSVPNMVGVAAVAEMRRRRKWQRDHGVCCGDGSCEACETEAEARQVGRQGDDDYERRYGRDY